VAISVKPDLLNATFIWGVHLLQILNIITDLKSMGWHHPDALHLIVEAMRIAYADRSEYLGDQIYQSPSKATHQPLCCKGVRKSAWIRHDHQVWSSQ